MDLYMNQIEFYEENGRSELLEKLEELRIKSNSNKDARIQYKQICLYIELLQQNGHYFPEVISKYIEKEIWELRPGKNRIFYFFRNISIRNLHNPHGAE